VIGLPRPDVKAALREAPDSDTGFEIRGLLPAGRMHILIEVQLVDEIWNPLFSQNVEVKHRWLPLWLGGGAWTELMFFQMPNFMTHAPHALQLERFPALVSGRSDKTKFSIVTPTFQQARFLKETMCSVLEQTNIICNYVVQDGGSTDGSVEIIRKYAKPTQEERCRKQVSVDGLSTPSPDPCVHLTAWESARDKGQADASVRAFAKTSGGPDDIMAWINSDDFYLPGSLAFVADFFARHPAVDVLYGHRVLVDEESREIGRRFMPVHDDEVLRLYDFVPQETMFWRRRIWDKVGGLDTSLNFAMDWDLLLRFQAAGAKIIRVPYFLACFRIHPQQKTSAALHDMGEREITCIRELTHGRAITPQELENSPRLTCYLRASAWIEFLWKLGIRAC
jgi:glycosyltransferase involved in cell wall biosynthesis